MTEIWVVVTVVGVATVLSKAAGPVVVGRRTFPARVTAVVTLLAPVMLTSLVVTQTVGGAGGLTVDARIPGVAAAAVALSRRVPIVGAMVIAAVVTGLVRLLA